MLNSAEIVIGLFILSCSSIFLTRQYSRSEGSWAGRRIVMIAAMEDRLTVTLWLQSGHLRILHFHFHCTNYVTVLSVRLCEADWAYHRLSSIKIFSFRTQPTGLLNTTVALLCIWYCKLCCLSSVCERWRASLLLILSQNTPLVRTSSTPLRLT
jgi:hypothetical protein